MRRFIVLILFLICAFSGCRSNSAETKTVEAKSTPSPTATPQPSPSKPKNGNYEGRGVVTKINLELVSVELDHEEIKGLMPKMVMEFFVTRKSELEKLSVGDRVEFIVEYKDGQEKITSIKKAE